MPWCVVMIPRARAIASPSDSGSIPTTAASSMVSEPLSSFIIRSVPILPDPMLVAFTLFTSATPAENSDLAAADAGKLNGEAVAGTRGLQGDEASRQDDVAGVERHAIFSQRVGEPRDRRQRRPLHCRAIALRQGCAVLADRHMQPRQVQRAGVDAGVAQHEHAPGRVDGDRVDDADLQLCEATFDGPETVV